MFPTLIDFGPVGIHSYGLLLAIGLLLGRFVGAREYARRGYDPDFASVEMVIGAVGGVVGARLFDVLEHPDSYGDPSSWISGAGLTFYGGLLVGIPLVFLAARSFKVPPQVVSDVSSFALALGYGFGRLGCFFSGDGCYGMTCRVDVPAPICMAFPNGYVPTDVPVWNTPLLETTMSWLLFAWMWRDRAKMKPLEPFARFFLVHGLARFLVEFARLNPILALGMTQAQWISIGIMAAGGVAWWVSRKRAALSRA